MDWKSYFTELLRSKYQDRYLRNSSYSMRAFARDLNLSSGALTELYNRQRSPSKRKVLEICELLKLSAQEERHLFQLLGLQSPADTRVTLLPEAYDLISSWYFPAILCAFELDSPPRTIQELSHLVKMQEPDVAEAVDRLCEVGFLKKDGDGFLSATGVFYQTRDDLPHERIRQFHREGLQKAEEALEGVAPAEREFNSITFEGSSESLAQAKQLIRNFREELIVLMQQGRKDRVYRMNIQLWPLTEIRPIDHTPEKDTL